MAKKMVFVSERPLVEMLEEKKGQIYELVEEMAQ